MITNKFQDKIVLITGHTGFKGSWLSMWLSMLGAKVYGVSDMVLTSPSHFVYIKPYLEKDIRLDITASKEIKELINDIQPDYVFHLAAQSLVNRSYSEPVRTWNTNLMGTINILEGLNCLRNDCFAVLITSDKCYENLEWFWGYRETDKLGGSDPYSASKAATEIAINSYIKSYFSSNSKVRIASARAGNVIGGGDWSDNRLMPDCIKAWSEGKSVILRKPESTRPWQHVLEPLGGYIKLAKILSENLSLHGQSFNFGPNLNQNYTVLDVVTEMSKHWNNIKYEISETVEENFKESNLLKLNCDKALYLLNWSSSLNFYETIRFTSTWYKQFYEDPVNIFQTTKTQINEYSELLLKNNIFDEND